MPAEGGGLFSPGRVQSLGTGQRKEAGQWHGTWGDPREVRVAEAWSRMQAMDTGKEQEVHGVQITKKFKSVKHFQQRSDTLRIIL